MKRLIVNADDLGRSEGIDRGIVRAHREGIVTSATFMANVAGAERAAALARATPSLDVGVHLVLTFGRPLSDARTVPSLVGADGAFPAGPREMRHVDGGEVLREYRAQYARARRLLGREPTHVDTHHFVQEIPAVFEALVALARETGSAARSQSPAQRDALRSGGVRTTDAFRRDFQFEGHIDSAALLAIVASLEDGVTELMCHPGEPDPALERTSSYARERPAELAALTDPAVRARLDALGIVLTTFRDL